MMTMQDLEHWLGEWGFWATSPNRSKALGIKEPAYAMREGSAPSEPIKQPSVEAEVLRLHQIIDSMPPDVRDPLAKHYCDPRQAKAKGAGRSGYYSELNMAKRIVLHQWNAAQKHTTDSL